MKAKLLLITSCALNCALAASASARNIDDSYLLKDGWIQSSPGVYTMTEGSVEYQLSMGTEGARHDIEKLTDQYNDLAQKSTMSRSASDTKALADLGDAIAGIPEKAGGTVRPMTSSSGNVCDVPFKYDLDSHFVAGTIGATAVSRAMIGELTFSAPVTPSAVSMHTSATVTPTSSYWGSTVSSAFTDSVYDTQPNAAVASWQPPAGDFPEQGGITSSACTASTYQYVSINYGSCPGGTAFVSLTKSYTSCVSSP